MSNIYCDLCGVPWLIHPPGCKGAYGNVIPEPTVTFSTTEDINREMEAELTTTKAHLEIAVAALKDFTSFEDILPMQMIDTYITDIMECKARAEKALNKISPSEPK